MLQKIGNLVSLFNEIASKEVVALTVKGVNATPFLFGRL